MKYCYIFLIFLLSCQNVSNDENNEIYKKWRYQSSSGPDRIVSILDLRTDHTFDDTLLEYIKGKLDEAEYGTGTFQVVNSNLILNRYEYTGIKPKIIPQSEIKQDVYEFNIKDSKLRIFVEGSSNSIELSEVKDY